MTIIVIRHDPFYVTEYKNAKSVSYNYETDVFTIVDSSNTSHTYSKENYFLQFLL